MLSAGWRAMRSAGLSHSVRMRSGTRSSAGKLWAFLDSGLVVVIFICLGYLLLVFALLFFVKNEWCDLLFKNMTENIECRPKSYNKVGVLKGTDTGNWKDLIHLTSNQRRQQWKKISSQKSSEPEAGSEPVPEPD